MPTTRSPVKKVLHHEEPPASPTATVGPSAPATSVTAPSTRRTAITRAQAAREKLARIESERETVTEVTELPQQTKEPCREVRPPPSMRSTSSAAARIRQAELQAEERLAEIRRRELQLEAELIRKRLAADVADIREEEAGGSITAEEVPADSRINDWLERSAIRGEPHHGAERKKVEEDTLEPRERRRRSPTPTRHRDRGIDRLADVFEKMMFQRAPPRQTTDLPLFSGATGEWLPFKAAMESTTRLHRFTPAENLARLRTCLRGQAKEAVSALLYTASDPRVIMKTLEQCFGRPEVIIDDAFENIRRLPKLGQSTLELNNFAIKLQNIVTAISCIDERGYLQNPMLVRQVVDKLTPHIKSKWCDYAEECDTNEPEIVVLSRFLMREADRAMRHSFSNTAATTPAPTGTHNKNPGRRIKGAAVYTTTEAPATTNRQENAVQCYCCGSEHRTTKCQKLLKMSVSERWNWAREARVCFRCLESKHKRYNCKAKTCNKCKQTHNTLLHESREVIKEPATRDPLKEDIVTSVRQINNKQVLLKVCPVTLRVADGTPISTYALLGEDSTVTLLDEELATVLGAQGPSKTLNIKGITASQREPTSRVVDIEVRGKSGTRYYPIKARTMKNLDVGTQTIEATLLGAPHLSRLRRDEVCLVNAKPQILIGADNWHLIVTRKLLVGKNDQPAASHTRLGWIIHGSAPRSSVCETGRESVLHVRTLQDMRHERADSSEELHALVKEHFSVDALGIEAKRKTTPEVKRALDIFDKTARRSDGHFEVGLLWRGDDVTFPPSYDMALRRLRGIERRMDRLPEFKAAYVSQINRLLSKGYAVECNGKHEDSREWYLPHFAVTNPNKPGKIRVVFDAAARANGKCLNDELLDGPDLLQALHGVLFRFRERAVAVTADVREMFLRVKIRQEDRVAQHFLWRGEDRQSPPRKYIMSSMIFGARCSPFLAHSVRNKNATEFRTQFPRAYEEITLNHYMDDWLGSFDSVSEARAAVVEVREVHRHASFELGDWDTNRGEVLVDIPQESRARAPKELGASVNMYGKTLGMLWLPETDELAFNTTMPRVPAAVRERQRPPTKREALSVVMSIFDPLGLLSPYTIAAKIILQSLWRQKLGWDEPLPSEESAAFDGWMRDLDYVRDLRVPRCYSVASSADTPRQLHVFVDASEQAYSAAAYWRIETSEGVIVSLVAAKAKVAPLKSQSMPRMELQAALVGARLAAGILKEHRWESEVTYWSDSKTTLQWIRNDAARYTPYVAHRLAEIAELTRPDQWRWVPSDMNVADDATRAGRTRLTEQDRWFHGPRFLQENGPSWPQERETCSEDEREQAAYATRSAPASASASWIDVRRFSSYERLVRTVAFVLLFVERTRRMKRELNVEHLRKAERLLVKEAQSDSFARERTLLEKGQCVGRTSRLYRLDPTLKDGVLCLKGRIDRATVASEEMKAPAILDGSHHFTRLLIKREHEMNNHIGREHVVNNVRQKYWGLRLRPTVRSVLFQCAVCKARRASPKVPVKGDLPLERVKAFSRPFSQCGIDCFGPMWVTIGRRREKRWGMLFTCLVTRAIHIEMIASLNTDSAIMAIRRMSARRGWPETIITDNGTNFRGADQELANAQKEWQPQVKEYLLGKRVNWKYTDPGAPNQGGAWERLVKSVKIGLATALSERQPKEEVLATVMTEIENTVNSRPLTVVSVDAEDAEALTPNHFLLGSAAGLPITGPTQTADRRTWRAAMALADMFWQRWTREYLPTLTPRGDAHTKNENVKVNDVVLIADGLLPRNMWPIGRVQKVFEGPDGVVRSAEVRTRGGSFRRPVRRLVVLPTEV